MLFFLGFIVGLLFALIMFVATLFFRSPIEKVLKATETKIDTVRPKERGFVYIPESDADEAREQIIAENQRRGFDTKLESLQ